MNAVHLQPGQQGHGGLRKFVHWTPRILAILFVLFLSMFALDVFGTQEGVWNTLVALFMHLIPSFLLIALLVLAWRWPWVGTVAFCGWGVWYIISSWGMFDWTAPVLLGVVPIGVGLLFLADWWMARRRSEIG